MTKKIPNPFTPSHPAAPQNLKGREREILEIDKSLSEAKNGRANHFLIIGDRGIGKTSLLHYANKSARTWNENFEENFSYIVVNVKIDKSTTQTDLAKDIYTKINNELSKNNSNIKKTFEKTWGFLQRVEFNGNKINPAPEVFSDNKNTINEISEALIEIVAEHCGDDDYDGILILIDEADQSSSELNLGAFVKYITENLEFECCSKIIFGLSGLTSTIEKLTSSHASSLRIFNIIRMPKLKDDDLREILDEIKLSLSSSYDITFNLAEEVRNHWWEISDGHPHHIQQIGHQAFKIASFESSNESKNLEITYTHLMRALYDNSGVVDIIGSTYCQIGLSLFSSNGVLIKLFRSICSAKRHKCTLDQLASENLGLSMLDIERQLTQLEMAEMIHRDANDKSYIIKYPLYAHWFSKYFPETVTA